MRVVALLLVLWVVAHAERPPRGALVIVVDRVLTPEKLDVVNRAIREALTRMDDDVRVAIVGAGRKPHVVAPYAVPMRIRLSEITGDVDGDVTAALGRAFQILNIKARQLAVSRAIVISDRDALPGVSSYAKKMADANYQVSTYGLGKSSANRKTLDAIATSGHGAAYHQRDGDSLADALVEQSWRVGPPPNRHAYVVVFDHTAAVTGPRIERAKDAVRAGFGGMSPNDLVSLIEFATAARVFVHPQPAGNKMRLANDIARLTPITDAETGDLAGALELAIEVVEQINARRKHVVIVASAAWPLEGVAEAVRRLQARSVDVRCIAAEERLRKPLERLAPTIVLDPTDDQHEEVVKLFAHAPVDE